ncbi:MAG: L-rhamnose isomerase [Ruminococcaceae bacterium]|nr:L-rhamnose isomerase [Oscillospiraceae bacterium]
MSTKNRYEAAKAIYAELGVDTDAAIKLVSKIPVSMHCWQGDDVHGFENPDGDLTGGIQVTGNYPGKATNLAQLRADFDKAASLIPGKKRINLHSFYLDSDGEKVSREKIAPKHFDSWIDWAKERDLGIDYNPSCFSHPMSDDGLTISHPDKAVRDFWIEHCKGSRKVAAYIGEKLGNTVITNFWMPDGYKDIPADRYGTRLRMKEAYDEIFKEQIDEKFNKDAIESKVFGIGAESCTIGSGEFCMGYAAKNNKLLTLDTGHFHPTEVVSDKISSTLLFLNEILLHVSRPVRWDSDHVVIYDDELRAIACEILRGGFTDRVHIGLDFFDGSINRIAAWTIGTRSMQKALLFAALEPSETLRKLELEGDYTSRLALMEEIKTLPFAAVWDMYCEMEGVPTRASWLSEVKQYEKDVLSKR